MRWRQRVRALAVHVLVDPVPGREPCQHRLGVDRLGAAAGRRGLRHHRQQEPLPDRPYRIRVVTQRRPVAFDEPEHDVVGVGEAEVVVLLGGVFLPPHLLRQPPDRRPQRLDVHRDRDSAPGPASRPAAAPERSRRRRNRSRPLPADRWPASCSTHGPGLQATTRAVGAVRVSTHCIPAPSITSKMKWTRVARAAVERPVRGEVVHFPRVAGLQVERRAPHRQRRLRVRPPKARGSCACTGSGARCPRACQSRTRPRAGRAWPWDTRAASIRRYAAARSIGGSSIPLPANQIGLWCRPTYWRLLFWWQAWREPG